MERKGQHGASAVEFAIVLPILLWIIFGIIEFGFILYDKAMITNASREGARAGVVFRVPQATDDEIIQVVKSFLGNSLITFGEPTSEPAPVNVTVTRSGYAPGDGLRVKVEFTYKSLILPDLVKVIGGEFSMGREFSLVGQTAMRME